MPLLLVTEPLVGGCGRTRERFDDSWFLQERGGQVSVDGRGPEHTHTHRDKQGARLWLQGKKGTASRTGTVVVEKKASRPADLPLGQRHCQQCRVEACPMACDRHTPRKRVRSGSGRLCVIGEGASVQSTRPVGGRETGLAGRGKKREGKVDSPKSLVYTAV